MKRAAQVKNTCKKKQAVLIHTPENFISTAKIVSPIRQDFRDVSPLTLNKQQSKAYHIVQKHIENPKEQLLLIVTG